MVGRLPVTRAVAGGGEAPASGRGVNGHATILVAPLTLPKEEPGNGVRGPARLADAGRVEQPELGRWRALRSPEAAPDGGDDGL